MSGIVVDPALFRAVCEHGFQGVVAKRQMSRYGPNVPGWIKTKNPMALPGLWPLIFSGAIVARASFGLLTE